MSTYRYGLNHDFSYERIIQTEIPKLKRTKMICTIGPASEKLETLVGLIQRGMTIARLNFSHGDHESHLKKLETIRQAVKIANAKGRVGIMLDTKGPEVRTGFLNEKDKKIELNKGDKIKVTGDYSVKCDNNTISISYPDVAKFVKPGDRILIGDGNLTLRIEKVNAEDLDCIVLNDYLLGERKNVNLPGVKINLPVITEKDRRDIVDFGIKHKVDFIALSFTRTKECITMCKEVLGEHAKTIKIIPKIENLEGLQNIREIIRESFGLMMARGDLGMELDPSKVLIAQKYMTEVCRRYGRPVICATQMLESMTQHSRPTRAEMSDVGNAVLDSVDSVMLSGETGNGLFVLESAKIMSSICKEVEKSFDNEGYFKQYKKIKEMKAREPKLEFVLAVSAAKLAFTLKSNTIIVIDSNGEIVRNLSRLRLKSLILYPHFDEDKLRKFCLSFGVFGIKVSSKKDLDLIDGTRKFIKDNNLQEMGSNTILVDYNNQNVKIMKL